MPATLTSSPAACRDSACRDSAGRDFACLGSAGPGGKPAPRSARALGARFLVSAACWVLAAGAASSWAQPSWEFSPYEIEVWLAVEPSTPINRSYFPQLAQSLREHAETAAGAAWTLHVAEPPADLLPDMQVDLELVSVEAIESSSPDVLKRDKLMLLVLGGDAREYRLRCRELDCRTRSFGPLAERRLRQLEALPRDCFEALAEAFAAVVRIESGEGRELVVRVRSGGLILDSQSLPQVQVGDFLQPIIRRNDRLGKPLNVETVEWTFLQVAGENPHNPNLLDCRVHSGWRSPIRGRAGARREQYALAIRPRGEITQLRVQAKVRRGEQAYPLAGLEVYAKIPTVETAPQSQEEQLAEERRNPPLLLGHTDWRGAIEVAAADLPMRLIYIKSGGQLLARLPLVPGLSDLQTAEVPDDEPRLQAEGFLKGFNGELMDLVAQRQLLAARIRRQIEEGDAEEAEKLMNQFRQLPSRNDMQRQLDQQQNRQQISANRAVQARIDGLYAESRKAVSAFLDPDLGNRLMRELSQVRPAQ